MKKARSPDKLEDDVLDMDIDAIELKGAAMVSDFRPMSASNSPMKKRGLRAPT